MTEEVRTTITLDDEAAAIVDATMRADGLGFEQAVNELIKAGAGGAGPSPFRTPVCDLGLPQVDLTRALRLAGDLEDERLVGRQRRGA